MWVKRMCVCSLIFFFQRYRRPWSVFLSIIKRPNSPLSFYGFVQPDRRKFFFFFFFLIFLFFWTSKWVKFSWDIQKLLKNKKWGVKKERYFFGYVSKCNEALYNLFNYLHVKIVWFTSNYKIHIRRVHPDSNRSKKDKR